MRSRPAETNSVAGRQRGILAYVALGALIVAFSALGIYYSLHVPLFETPDEPAHYRYVRYLAEERALPPLVVSEDEWGQGEFHQPPLYYALGAMVTGGIQYDHPLDDDPIMARNPYAKLGLPLEHDNKNAMLHLSPEEPSDSNTAQAVHMLRWLGVALSCGTIALVWATTRMIVPNRPHVPLLAAAVTALNPQFIFASAAANNDTLVTLLSTATLWCAVRVIMRQDRLWRTPIVLGALVGAAGLTKLSGLAVSAVVPVAYGLRWLTADERNLWRDVVRPTLIAAGVALAICSWWYARNQILYQDALGMRSYRAIFQVYAEPLGLGEALRLLTESFVSYWGVFGWMNVLTSEAYYLIMRLLCLLAGGGLVLRFIESVQRRRTLSKQRLAMLLLGAWLAVMLGLLLRWTQTITRTQGRLLFPAATTVSLFLVLGGEYWLLNSRSGRGARIAVTVGVIALLGGMSAMIPWATLAPAYAHPTTIAMDDTAALDEQIASMRGLDIAYGDELVLLGFELGQEEAQPGDRISLRLYWLCRERIHENLTIHVHLFGLDEQRIGALDTYPGLGTYPTSLWVPGQVVVDDYFLNVDPDAEAPVAAELRVGVYHTDSIELLPAEHLSGQALSPSPGIGRIRILPNTTTEYVPANASGALLGDRVMLIGSRSPGSATAGASLPYTLYWRCEQTMLRDYTVFLHVVDSAGEIVAQKDGQPLNGQYPTSYWVEGQEIEDRHSIDLDSSLPAGEYEIRVGLYDGITGERLEVTGAAHDNHALIIDTVHIDRATP